MNKSFLRDLIDVQVWLDSYEEPVMSLDTETDGLHFGCKLKGISLCNGKEACYINLDNNPDFDLIIAELLNVICGIVKLLILHHAAFDLRVLKSVGIEYTGKIFDTQVAAHLLNENQPCALKKLAHRVLKVPEKDIVDFETASKFGLSSQKFLDYASTDSIWTYQLYEIERPLLTKQGLDKLFYEIEMPFAFVLVDLFNNGIKIDQNKLKEFEEILTERKAQYEKELVEAAGLKMIEDKTLFGWSEFSLPLNLNSNPQLAKIIKEKCGIDLPLTEPSKAFPKGQPSTAVEILEPLKAKHPFIDLLLKYRKTEKLLNTFITPMWKRIDKDGRVRTSFSDCVARTGRLSSSEPNLQNIPKELSNDEIVNVRELFISDEDRDFVIGDWESQELRQLANLTKDKNLINAFNKNYDLHLFTARECLGLPILEEKVVKTNPDYKQVKEFYKKERHIGKNGINFPIVYGSTAYGIAQNNNVSEETAQEWLDGFNRTYPDVSPAIKRCRKEVWENHCVRNYFGRKRRFGELNDKSIRQAFNFKIQGFCVSGDSLVFDSLLGLVPVKELSGLRTLWDGTGWSTGTIVETGKKKVVKVKLSNDSIIKTSSEHRFLTVNSAGYEIWKTPKEFCKQQYIRLSESPHHWELNPKLGRVEVTKVQLQKWNILGKVHNQKDYSFDDITNPFERGIILGRLASDGCYTSRGQLIWLVAEHEKEILDLLVNILMPFNPSVSTTTRDGYAPMHKISVNSICLMKQVKYLDIKNKLHNYFTLSSELLRGYLIGYCDGDGTALPTMGVSICFGRRHKKTKLVEGIQQALTLFGVRSRIGRYTDSVRLNTRSSDLGNFMKYIGFLNNKKNKLLILHNRKCKFGRTLKVDSVEFLDDTIPMFDFVNSTTGKFMIDGVVVHNCADLLRLTMIRIRECLLNHPEWEGKLVLTIHDSIVVEVNSEYSQECLKEVKYIMENTINLEVPFLVEMSIGKVMD